MVVDKYSDKYSDTRKGYPYIHGFSKNNLDIGKPARADKGNEQMKWDIGTTCEGRYVGPYEWSAHLTLAVALYSITCGKGGDSNDFFKHTLTPEHL
jgi:hypothetical protein